MNKKAKKSRVPGPLRIAVPAPNDYNSPIDKYSIGNRASSNTKKVTFVTPSS